MMRFLAEAWKCHPENFLVRIGSVQLQVLLLYLIRRCGLDTGIIKENLLFSEE